MSNNVITDNITNTTSGYESIGLKHVTVLTICLTGIAFTDGPGWSDGRRIILKFLKNFGYGTNAMENIIATECKALVELRTADAGQLIPMNEMFDITIINILWRLMAGKR